MNIRGACHCGNIRLTLEWPDHALVPVRRCGCGFCRMRGGEWTSHPHAGLKIGVRCRQELSRYRFGTETADFLVCARCGLVPAAVSTIDGCDYAVVNVRVLQLEDAHRAEPRSSNFDTESRARRLDRRQRNWIAAVSLAYDDEY